MRGTRIRSTYVAWLQEQEEIRGASLAFGGRLSAEVVTVIPTYRRPQLLQRAVRSALDQQIDDHLVLVVDDAGGLPRLPTDPRLYAFSLSKNCGVPGVIRNIGIGATDSAVVAFLDDDNEWLPGHLGASLEAHRRGAELTYTGLRRVLPDGSPMDTISWSFDRHHLNMDQSVDSSTIVVKRKPQVRFSRVPRGKEDQPKEDWEFVFRLSRSMRTEHVPVATVTYLVNPQSYQTDWGL